VQVALATTGSDGASYQFPPGTQLDLFNNNTGFFGNFAIDGTETALTETVPIGSYTATLSFPSNGPVQLVRTSGGTSTTVAATWTDGQPYTFGVGLNVTTPIILHFSVVGLGDITFQVGKVQVSIDVNSTTTQMPGSGSQSGTIANSFQSFAAGLGLETPLGLTNGESDSEAVAFTVTSPFSLEATGFACASITPTSITSSSPSNTNAFNALMQEFVGPGGFASLCVQDQGTNDAVLLEIFRNGAAPSNQVSFLSGGNYQFGMFIQFNAGDVFSGSTLKLSQIAGPLTLNTATSAFWSHDIYDFNAAQFVEQSDGFYSAGTFQLSP
jgi:hypothetical protein